MKKCSKCSKCRKTALEVKFNKNRSKPDGLNNWCNSCRHERYKQDYPLKIRSNVLRMNFNLSMDEYQAILRSQDGKCKICARVCGTGKALSVDHNHKTGRVRGLLCEACNTGLGKFKDDSRLLFKAIEYLEVI